MKTSQSPSDPQELLQQIAGIQRMIPGKLCVIKEGPKGPYYSCQSWEDGRNLTQYVRADQVEAYREAIAGYERFQQLTGQYARQVIEQTRQELKPGSKKKQTTRLRRKSASPRKPKSGS